MLKSRRQSTLKHDSCQGLPLTWKNVDYPERENSSKEFVTMGKSHNGIRTLHHMGVKAHADHCATSTRPFVFLVLSLLFVNMFRNAGIMQLAPLVARLVKIRPSPPFIKCA